LVASPPRTPRYLERYYKALENHRRVEEGLGPLPYTEEDRRGDARCLAETIPAYRASAGWQTEEARAFLARWGQSVAERVAGSEGGNGT
jgi:CHASE3 domain sensor protein